MSGKKEAGFTKKTGDTKTAPKVVGFVNWSIATQGDDIRSSKGFPIFDNPEYPNKQEDLLIDLAKANGGSVQLTMKVNVVLNKSTDESKGYDLESVIIG